MAGLDPDLSSYAGYGGTNKLLATPTNSAENLNGWLSAARQGVALNAQQFDLAKQHLSALNDLVSSVMADPTQENATARIADGVRMGVIPHEEGTKELSDLAALGGDPNRIRQWAFQHGQVIGTLAERMGSAYGTTGLVNNGQQQMPMVTRSGPQGGVYPAGGAPIQNVQSPGELAAPRTYVDGQGVTRQTTQRGYQDAVGDPSGGVQNPNSYVDPKRAAQARIENGKVVYGPAASPAPAGVLPGLAGPSPGAVPAMGVTAEASAAQGVALGKAADNAPTRRATLSNMQDQLGKIATGPNAETWNTVKAGANGLLDIAGAPEAVRFDRTRIAAAEEFRKNAQMLANQQQQALGGTDAALAAGAHSNPNLDLSTLGNKQILQMLQGNEDAIATKNAAWQRWQQQGHGPDSYPQFAAEFNRTFSPRAFQWVHMEPGERADMLKTMNPQDRAALAGALKAGREAGWLRTGG